MARLTRQIPFILLVLLGAVLLFEYTDLNLWVQDAIYALGGGHWPVDRNEPVARFLFYDGVKKLYTAFVLSLLVLLLGFYKVAWVKRYRRGLVIVCLAVILVPLTVDTIKMESNVPCPSSLQHYGGTFPHVTLLRPWPAGTRPADTQRCYPAGHASGGFALMSLFFLFKRRRNRRIALVAAITTGWVIGIYKMLIGDHFLGHTMISMLLAWLLILIVARLVRHPVTLPTGSELSPTPVQVRSTQQSSLAAELTRLRGR